MFICANFKTNHTRGSTAEYLNKLNQFVNDNSIQDNVIVFPPNTAFDDYNLSNTIRIGVQNFYPVDKGSITGEIGYNHFKEFNIETVLIGHSERRNIINEEQKLINQKIEFAIEKNLKIVYCIGEHLDIKNAGLESTLNFLDTQLKNINIKNDNLIIAYEPIWAIGTGISATSQDIEDITNALSAKCHVPILYGGSVNSSNAEDILSIKTVDGLLIGSASLDVEEFCKILAISKSVQSK